MHEEDPNLLAGDNLDRLRGMNPMSERFRLWQELENAKYQNNLLAQRCRELEQERDEARRLYCEEWAFTMELERGEASDPRDLANEKKWDCYNTPEAKIAKTLNGIVTDGGKAVPPKYEDLEDE